MKTRIYLLSMTVLLAIAVLNLAPLAPAQNAEPKIIYKSVEDIAYRNGDDSTDYTKERCKLDVYHPNTKDFATIIWFHGGGLTGGNRFVPDRLKEKGVAVVAVNYRLSPNVKVTSCIDDAAAATAWVFRNIEKFGGSKSKIFVSGHSAGGYLTSMIGLDKKWLAAYDIDANRIAGLIPFSGHTITHFTVRSERGMDGKQPLLDEMAPLYHVRNDASPLYLITGDRELEMLGRYEENAYLWRMMQVVEHPDTTIHELDGYNHGEMADPAYPLLLKFVKQKSDELAGHE